MKFLLTIGYTGLAPFGRSLVSRGVSLKMKYFAYGSNMEIRRIRLRTPSARFVGAYTLEKYDLRFNKVGKDGSGKCNAFFTGFDSDAVEGVVYEIDLRDISFLDRAESYCYIKKNIEVVNASGESLQVFTYIGTKTNDTLLPFTWYKKHVLSGAQDSGLSAQYIEKIKITKATNDPNKDRAINELAIYEQ